MRRDSTEAELDALQRVGDRLAGFDARLSAEWLDGALTALMAGPRVPATPHDALRSLSGDAWERTFADPPDVAQAQAALDARWRVLRAHLDPESLVDEPDALHLAPLLRVAGDADAADGAAVDAGSGGGQGAGPGGSAPALGADWASGFLAVVRDPHGGWDHALAADAGAGPAAATVDETGPDPGWRTLLAPIERLAAGADGTDGADARTASAAEAAQQRVDAACFAAQDLRLWWSDHAPRTAPRRVAPTPGRNDPCPCGSGRKFKRCHGAGG